MRFLVLSLALLLLPKFAHAECSGGVCPDQQGAFDEAAHKAGLDFQHAIGERDEHRENAKTKREESEAKKKLAQEYRETAAKMTDESEKAAKKEWEEQAKAYEAEAAKLAETAKSEDKIADKHNEQALTAAKGMSQNAKGAKQASAHSGGGGGGESSGLPMIPPTAPPQSEKKESPQQAQQPQQQQQPQAAQPTQIESGSNDSQVASLDAQFAEQLSKYQEQAAPTQSAPVTSVAASDDAIKQIQLSEMNQIATINESAKQLAAEKKIGAPVQGSTLGSTASKINPNASGSSASPFSGIWSASPPAQGQTASNTPTAAKVALEAPTGPQSGRRAFTDRGSVASASGDGKADKVSEGGGVDLAALMGGGAAVEVPSIESGPSPVSHSRATASSRGMAYNGPVNLSAPQINRALATVMEGSVARGSFRPR